jgi:hypothetical protein
MSQSFKYATKVWLTTVVISPVTIIAYDYLFNAAEADPVSNLGFIGLAIFFSVILSLPVWLLMILSAKRINRTDRSQISKRMVMVLICLLLPLLLFVVLLFSTDTLDSDVLLSFPIFYICINTIAALVFPLKPEPSPLTYS